MSKKTNKKEAMAKASKKSTKPSAPAPRIKNENSDPETYDAESIKVLKGLEAVRDQEATWPGRAAVLSWRVEGKPVDGAELVKPTVTGGGPAEIDSVVWTGSAVETWSSWFCNCLSHWSPKFAP